MTLVIVIVAVIAVVIVGAWSLDLRQRKHRVNEDASEDGHRTRQTEREGNVFRKGTNMGGPSLGP